MIHAECKTADTTHLSTSRMAIQLTKCTPLAIPKEWQEIAAVWTKHTNQRTKIADKGSHTMLEPKADQVSPKYEIIRRMISSIPKTLLAEVLSVVFFLVHMILVRLFIAHGRQRSTVNWQRSGKHPGPNRHPQARHFIRRPGRCLLQTPQRARAIALCWMLQNNLVRFEAFSRAI